MSEFLEDVPEPAPEVPEAPPVDDSTPPSPEPTPRRIPNFAHALLFIAFAGLFLFLFELIVIAVGGPPATVHAGTTTIQHPKLQIAAEAATYLTTLLAAWFFYPLIWHRPFLEGMRWHWSTARNQANKLIGLGLVLGTMSAAVDYFITTSKPPPIDDFFLTQSDAWIVTFFGILVAPVFEEICFRGFLVPAFAIAYDWLSLPRTEEGRTCWLTTTALTPAALIFSAILSSLLFALLHGQQVAYTWNALLVLFCISLVLTFVRAKTQSVAASAMVHAAYNSFIFLMTIIGTSGYRHLERMSH
jgi:uncharacterized protein